MEHNKTQIDELKERMEAINNLVSEPFKNLDKLKVHIEQFTKPKATKRVKINGKDAEVTLLKSGLVTILLIDNNEAENFYSTFV